MIGRDDITKRRLTRLRCELMGQAHYEHELRALRMLARSGIANDPIRGQ
jgi:hypothetical protein